jgi:hypothetical protein
LQQISETLIKSKFKRWVQIGGFFSSKAEQLNANPPPKQKQK